MKESSLKVKLLDYTPNPEKHIYVAARLCYSNKDIEEITENVQEEEIKKLLNFLIKAGHHSALEHANFTFGVEGVSRTLTHQLVRHRLASYNQVSQRYTTIDEDTPFIIPPSIKENEEVFERFKDMVDKQSEFYSYMLEKGIEKEDARYIIGQGVETKIIITMNARELRHFFNHRCCRRAQWEIQSLANEMLSLVQGVAPILFFAAGAPCVSRNCPEGKMSCGNPFPKKVM